MCLFIIVESALKTRLSVGHLLSLNLKLIWNFACQKYSTSKIRRKTANDHCESIKILFSDLLIDCLTNTVEYVSICPIRNIFILRVQSKMRIKCVHLYILRKNTTFTLTNKGSPQPILNSSRAWGLLFKKYQIL